MSSEIPPKITEDQYDKLLRRLWELEQRVKGIETTVIDSTSLDRVFEQQRLIEKMFIKIGTRLFKKALKDK